MSFTKGPGSGSIGSMGALKGHQSVTLARSEELGIDKPTMTKDKQIAFTSIEQQMNEIHHVGEDIWRYREPPGGEERSHKRITQFLERKGFKVNQNYLGFANTFRAEFGEGEVGGTNAHPNICMLCQYDAEPRGHARGHNLVVVNALAAALGLQTVIKFATEPMGRITVIGCSSNSSKTMKSALFENNVFSQIDFILTAYPANYTNITPKFTSCKSYSVSYKGRTLHQRTKPWETANAVNATVLAYQNVAAARAHFMADWKATGVITHAGKKADVIPEYAYMEWNIRAPLPEQMAMLDAKVLKCLDAAATATGCTVEVKPSKKEFVSNISSNALRDLYVNNAMLNGFTFHNMKEDLEEPDDISHVSTSIPVLKVIYYHGDSAELGTDEYTRYVGSIDCEYAQVVQAKTLAMVGVDLMTSEDIMKTIFSQHQKELSKMYAGTRPEPQNPA